MCKINVLFATFLYTIKYSQNTSNYQQPLYQMPRHPRKSKAPPLRSVIPEGSYECERILDLRIEKGQRYYLIKWKGYDNEDDNTWQPITNLEYLMEDLLEYEEVHALKIQQLENQWKQLYQDKKSKFLLQPFDISEMQKKLQTWKHETEEPSEDTEEKMKNINVVCYKQKGIHKNRQVTKKVKKVKQQVLEQNYSHSAPSLSPAPRKRGRPRMISNIPPQQITLPKMPQLSQNNNFHSLSQGQNLDYCSERAILFETPSKKDEDYEEKATMSQKRCIKANLQDVDKGQSVEINEVIKPSNQIIDFNLFPTFAKPKSPQNNAYNPIYQLQPIPSQKSSNDRQQAPQPKKETFFKVINTSKYSYDSISLNSNHSPLHNNLMKYIYRKKKRTQRNESQSQSHEPIKSTFRNVIIQLQEQNKDLSSISNKSFHKHEEVQQLERDRVLQSLARPQESLEQGQEQQGQRKELVLHESAQHLPPLIQHQEQQLLLQQNPPFAAQQLDSISNKIVVSQNNEQQNEDNSDIQEIIPSQPRPQYAPLEENLSNAIHKPVELIVLDDNEAKQSQENFSKPQGYKCKKIKKQIRQIKINTQRKESKGITSRSQESLLLTQQGELFYRPSLNTLFQNMLSTNELKLLPSAKLVKIVSQFKIENIIFFTVKVNIMNEIEMRFVCYQSLREFFPRQLLIYLQENGKIEL